MSKSLPPACAQAREWLGLRVDGDLDAQHEAPLHAHLSACAACREVESWMARVDRLAAAEPDPGTTVAHLAELEARILYGLPQSTRRPWWRRFALPALVPSAALAMFVFLLVREQDPAPTQEMPRPIDAIEERAAARDAAASAEGQEDDLALRESKPTDPARPSEPAKLPEPEKLAKANEAAPAKDERARGLASTPPSAPAEARAEETALADALPSTADELAGREIAQAAPTNFVERKLDLDSATLQPPDPLLEALQFARQEPTDANKRALLLALEQAAAAELGRAEPQPARDLSQAKRQRAQPAPVSLFRADRADAELQFAESLDDSLRGALLRWLAEPGRAAEDSVRVGAATRLLRALE